MNSNIRRRFYFLQKAVVILAITLQVVLCRPDVSHLSGSGHLGKGKGYAYDKPAAPFDEGSGSQRGAELPEEPAEEYPDVFSALTPDAGNLG